MEKKIELDIECKSCKGTGLYSGFGESKGCAVVCSTCKGTGCHKYKLTYTPFAGRVASEDIEHVYEINPGYSVGKGNGFHYADFGGMPYKDWSKGEDFPAGSENRLCTCPAAWFQSADYKTMPEWEDCIKAGSFRDCKNFEKKRACWDKFDRENVK